MLSWVGCVVLFTLLLVPLAQSSYPSPPVLPHAYSVSINLTSTSWDRADMMQVYYTWDSNQQKKQRADHTNFMNNGDIVSLYFLDDRVYMVSRVTSACCILFATNMQASPDWLKQARYLGTQYIDGVDADAWSQNGYTWFDDDSTTTPLQWTFQLLPSRPKVTAIFSWFTPKPQPDTLFTPPQTCRSALICPIPYPDQAEAGIWNDSVIQPSEIL